MKSMICLDSNCKNSAKLAREIREILFYLFAFLSLLEKLESLLERLNMPMLLYVNAELKETSSVRNTWNHCWVEDRYMEFGPTIMSAFPADRLCYITDRPCYIMMLPQCFGEYAQWYRACHQCYMAYAMPLHDVMIHWFCVTLPPLCGWYVWS